MLRAAILAVGAVGASARRLRCADLVVHMVVSVAGVSKCSLSALATASRPCWKAESLNSHVEVELLDDGGGGCCNAVAVADLGVLSEIAEIMRIMIPRPFARGGA